MLPHSRQRALSSTVRLINVEILVYGDIRRDASEIIPNATDFINGVRGVHNLDKVNSKMVIYHCYVFLTVLSVYV